MLPLDLLRAAGNTIGDRGSDNGYDKGQERSAAKIAAVYNAITGQTITEADAWTFLICLKLVRMRSQVAKGDVAPGKLADSCIDLLGYAALLGEAVLPEEN